MAEAKISETLEFLTQIHEAWDGTEQRQCLRYRPHRSISYDYFGTENWQSQYLRSLAYSQQTQMFQIPLWHCAESLIKDSFKFQSNLYLPTDVLWQWRGCGGAVTWYNDEYGGDYTGVTGAYLDGKISLAKPLTTDALRGTTFVPVAWGILSNSENFVNVNGDVTTLNLGVEIMKESLAPEFPTLFDEFHPEAMDITHGTNLPAEYLEKELFLVPPTWASDMNATFARNATRLDNSAGAFIFDLKSDNPTETRTIEYSMHGRNEINNMQRFFIRCRGKCHSFYSPTWLQDVELAADAEAGSDEIFATYNNYWRYYSKISRRKTICVMYKDGKAEILKIAGYSTDDTGELGKIYLEDKLKKALIMKDIEMISFLNLYRHDNDAMTVDFESVQVGSTSFVFKEVDA